MGAEREWLGKERGSGMSCGRGGSLEGERWGKVVEGEEKKCGSVRSRERVDHVTGDQYTHELSHKLGVVCHSSRGLCLFALVGMPRKHVHCFGDGLGSSGLFVIRTRVKKKKKVKSKKSKKKV